MWKIGLSCALTGFITYMSIRWLKNRTTKDITRSTAELLADKWLKVGKVKELYFYPLKSGRGKNVLECKFTELGIAMMGSDGQFTLRDRYNSVVCVELPRLPKIGFCLIAECFSSTMK